MAEETSGKRVNQLIGSAAAATVKAYAEKHDITNGEAADKLIATAASRLAALSRYAKNKEPMAPGKPRAAKKAAAKKPAKKAAKKPAASKPAEPLAGLDAVG